VIVGSFNIENYFLSSSYWTGHNFEWS